jgi:hypothetical protein
MKALEMVVVCVSAAASTPTMHAAQNSRAARLVQGRDISEEQAEQAGPAAQVEEMSYFQ